MYELRHKPYSIIAGFIIALLLIAVTGSSCAPQESTGGGQAGGQASTASHEPTIEAAPLREGTEHWKIATSDDVRLTVTAPGADRARILYRPVGADGRQVALKSLTEPSDRAGGRFTTEIRATEDFAGDVWAVLSYPDGAERRTQPIALTTETAADSRRQQNITAGAAGGSAGTGGQATAGGGGNGNVGDDESARSDRATGGRIEKASLNAGGGDIKVTVNVPAFRLTLWQKGKEIATYDVGVGVKDFPVVIGERKANRIILNPAWIPPDSEWVDESSVTPGERYTADDPKNPLGKIKIPLGDGYLIHQAQSPSDLGNLVSHGCIRMMRDDLFDLSQKIADAYGLSDAGSKLSKAKDSTERMTLDLDSPLVVDINYDTQVVEGGRLHIYPDVYDRDTNTVEKLREELSANDVETSGLDEQTLKQMLERAGDEQAFVVSLSDLRSGRALEAGRNEPLTRQQAKGNSGD